nr:MAG TPA: hypothetical protein [Caudoviricetes sp.]
MTFYYMKSNSKNLFSKKKPKNFSFLFSNTS